MRLRTDSDPPTESAPRKVLVIGDAARRVSQSISDALPHAEVETAETVFDGIADLHATHFDAVVTEIGHVDERPEAATNALREACDHEQNTRHFLLADAEHEPLGRSLVETGVAEDYAMLPATSGDLSAMLTGVPVSLPDQPLDTPGPLDNPGDDPLLPLRRLTVAETFLKAQTLRPGRALHAVVDVLNEASGSVVALSLEQDPPAPREGHLDLRHPLRDASLTLRLTTPADVDANDAEVFFARLAGNLDQLAKLDQRHEALQRLAYFDDLTGIHNGRYFRWFLSRILDRARRNYFPVTLLLFDIDNFKQYNDKYGHAVGDDILRQTAQLMRRCCREHDCVARISGDEFAVVFWEKEGPREPHDPEHATTNRVPQTPLAIANRFRRLLSDSDFPALGQSGRGKLTISGGMAVFPYDAHTAEELIDAADKALMFNAKQHGKNSIALVSGANGNGHGH
ncbi:MAG: GGDEF domain-containing protein [Planctomycetota bacterium]